ncbi:terminase small subunit [Cronobacter sakazakii]|uniref:terminase small subunit n=1 Tax=Cronobacter sakazakii TaxID=28141 RepID=UPI00355BE1C1
MSRVPHRFERYASGYSGGVQRKTANEQGSQNLAKLNIQSRISELKAERNDRVEVDADYVLKRLFDIDQMDVADIILANGEIKPIKDWPKVWRTTLSGIDVIEMAAADSSALLKKLSGLTRLRILSFSANTLVLWHSKSRLLTNIRARTAARLKWPR